MTYLDQLFSLDQKVAVVTGASRGLGRGIAEALLKAGATTVLVSANSDRLHATHQEFATQNIKATAYPCDLSVHAQVDALVDHVLSEHGRRDVLVNDAGVTFTEELFDYPDEYWEKTLRVNLEAPYRLAKNFAPVMKDQDGGSIINITSIAAERGASNNPAYAATKGGLRQMTKALASDLAPLWHPRQQHRPRLFPHRHDQLQLGRPSTPRPAHPEHHTGSLGHARRPGRHRNIISLRRLQLHHRPRLSGRKPQN